MALCPTPSTAFKHHGDRYRFFENQNDHLGHQAGDICLTQITEVLSQITNRNGELAAHNGSEGFLLLFRVLTEAEK